MGHPGIQRWLEEAVASRGNVSSALVVLGTFERPGRSAHWPAGVQPDTALLAAARHSLHGAPGRQIPAQGIVTRPVRAKGEVVGTLALRLADSGGAAANAGSLLPPAQTPGNDAAGLPLLDLLEHALRAPDLRHAASEIANRLCEPLGCERVMVGVSSERATRVAGVSHGSDVGAGSSWMRVLAAAMDEAVDQGAAVRFPQDPAEQPRITLAHAELAQLHPGRALLSVPMFADGRRAGALTFVRPAERPFDDAALQQAQRIGAALGLLLHLRHENESSLSRRMRGRWRRHAGEPGSRQRRWVWGGASLAIVALSGLLVMPVTHEVVATTRLEGRIQRAMVAPVDGYLKSAQVRPGDLVKSGQLLAELSDEDLQLERRRLESELARHESGFAEAQARADRAQLVGASARINEARAQLALLEQQIERAQLRAPFDGRVLAGELAPQLGAPIKRGDVLLTLAPNDDFRVLLEIDERDVAHVGSGLRGTLALAAMPEQRQSLVLQRIMPVALASDGRNVFEAEARLDGGAVTGLRPGLQGVARIDAGQQALGWVLGHRVLDWLRLQWWAWLG